MAIAERRIGRGAKWRGKIRSARIIFFAAGGKRREKAGKTAAGPAVFFACRNPHIEIFSLAPTGGEGWGEGVAVCVGGSW
jgi:hypothetical protein